MLKLKQFISLCLLFTFHISEAHTHIRLWRGFKQDTLSQNDFKKNVSSQLVPATVTVAQNKGLVSYMPVFTNTLENKQAYIPDEIAVIQYADEATYKALASTPEFSAYGKMHYQEGFFIKTNQAGFTSGSLVSTPISEESPLDLTKANAVDFGDVDPTWKNELVQVTVVHLNKTDAENSQCAQNLLKDLKTAVKTNQLSGFILAYDPQYILVYTKNKNVRLDLNTSDLCSNQQSIPLKNKNEFSDEDNAVNIQF